MNGEDKHSIKIEIMKKPTTKRNLSIFCSSMRDFLFVCFFLSSLCQQYNVTWNGLIQLFRLEIDQGNTP